jgi:hypothetical protein
MFSAKYGVLRWSDRIPNYDYLMQKEDIGKFVPIVKDKLSDYDKVFFIGLGGYRQVLKQVKEESGIDIEIFPRPEISLQRRKRVMKRGLQSRDKNKAGRSGYSVDMLDYTGQMRDFRDEIVKTIPAHADEKIWTIRLDSFIERTSSVSNAAFHKKHHKS